jgi:hypothetical protein
VHKLLNGTRRVATLGSLAIVALVTLAIGCYVGYQACLRIFQIQAGKLNFSVPSFQSIDVGSLDSNEVSLQIESLRVQATTIDSSIQALFIASATLTAIAVLFATVTVVFLCYRLVRGKPFAAGFGWLVATSGFIALAAGALGPVLEGAAKKATVSQLSGIDSGVSPLAVGDLVYYAMSSFNLMPVCVGMIALLLAAVFRSGDSLNRDAMGLV